jgi:hypothetical protein
VGQWDFDSGLNASPGVSLEYFEGPGGATETNTQFGTTATFAISNVAGQVVNVMRVPKTTNTMGYVLNPNAVGNGGGGLLNQYSLVFDLYFPSASSGKSRCLIQLDEPWGNSNEGEFYVAANNGLGTPAKPQGTVTPDTWHRLVITVDLAATPPQATKYIDGAKVGQETLADALDGRWALGTSRALLFTDNTGAFEVAYVNSIQVHDLVLSPGYVAALGAPAGDAIPAAVVPVAVVDAVRPAAQDAFVLPSTFLEADLLPAGQPMPTNSLHLFLDGAAVPPTLTYPSAGVLRLSFDPGLLAPGSLHTARVAFVDPVVGTNVQQVEWSFRLCPYQLPPPDPTTEGLLYLGFEEPLTADGSAVTDRSPARNHGVLRLQSGVGDLQIVGAVSNAIDFTINQTVPENYVELTNGYGAVPNSFAAWVKVDSNYPSATRVGVMLGNYPVTNAINWELSTAGRPRVYWAYGSGSLLDWTVSDDLRTGQWEHLAFVRDPARGFFYYRNGRLAAAQTNAGPTVLPVEAAWVGADRRAAGYQPFRGALDEVTIFARSLGSNEVFRLYTAPVNFPKYLFATPPITRLAPLDGATGVAATERLEVLVDESFSSNTVNLTSVQLSLNGTAVTPQAVRSNQTVRIFHVPARPLTPLTTNQMRVRFLDNAAAPHETIRQWSFVTAPAPVILWVSLGTTVAAGEEVAFGVQAAGVPPIGYQWRLNGVALPGETNTVLALPALTAAQAGTYAVVVSNPSGAATSRAIPLAVVPALPLGGLLDSVTAYYGFDTQTNWVVTNSAPLVDGTGFASDALTLLGGAADPSARIYPITHNPALARAGQGALVGDGTNNCARINGNPVDPNQDWSVAAWFKPDTGGLELTGSARAFIFETGGTTYPISFGLRAGTGAHSTMFQRYTQTAGTSASQDWAVPAALVDQWHQIVLTYDAALGSLTGYLDGSATYNLALGPGTTLQSYTGFHVGTYRSADGRWFKGLIDELAFWQRRLSASEVGQLLTLGKAGAAVLTGAPEIRAFAADPAPAESFTLTWRAASGLQYVVEASSDLRSWPDTIATNCLAAAETVSIVISPAQPPPTNGYYDPGLRGASQRFYRVRWNP